MARVSTLRDASDQVAYPSDTNHTDLYQLNTLDYDDPMYARLARIAQRKIGNDLDLRRHLYTQGMTFVIDGGPSTDTELWRATLELANLRQGQEASLSFQLAKMSTRDSMVMMRSFRQC